MRTKLRKSPELHRLMSEDAYQVAKNYYNRFVSIAIVKKVHMGKAFDALIEEKFINDNIEVFFSFISYFERQWVGVKQVEHHTGRINKIECNCHS